VRLAPSTHTRGLVPSGSWSEFVHAGPSRGLGRRPPMDAASLLDLPAGSEAARPGLVTRSVTGSSWPGQLPGVGPWRHPGRGLGHAGSRRRQHEEIVDGDAGRTAPVFHLSRSTASKLTILLQPCLSAPRQRRPTQARPASAVRPTRPSRHVALEGRRLPREAELGQPSGRCGHHRPQPPARWAGLPLPLVLLSSAIDSLERSAAHRGRNVWPPSSGR
jgi:hypothetical protein